MGVVLLEIVSGKKNRGFRHTENSDSLLSHACLLWKEDKALELIDECLKYSFVECQVKRCIHVGLLCVQKYAEDRPVMSSVLFMLGSEEGANLPNPKEPVFFMGGSSSNEETCKAESIANTMTITDLEARVSRRQGFPSQSFLQLEFSQHNYSGDLAFSVGIYSTLAMAFNSQMLNDIVQGDYFKLDLAIRTGLLNVI
ncbi:S-locus lectin protein kinase family protein [Abeliophyllum distichum]|uniref:S-locus lectin protein kinase family protein n=1 Tax=Abeliophyllum distichum TaxID=126358 RepID=A0ABD1QKW1_9LAMI